ncbi:MAG: 2-isopropylmalate synthase [Evtepia sp.]|uniref:2-isopropylmalate synthase n=1 Tax=Evtepia sp. TaxID=2773933 RepID=UPI002A764791|nr:2-isopropylmalate synthase [Evtepia sp.]MDY3015303.1 2-isopropylmalate synthase [Evtepia sp.]
MKNFEKYRPGYYMPPETCMEWAKKDRITQAPDWCSVDLRDGNQALITPMNLEEKIAFYQFLLKLGFKEIEVGFPAASETEYEFLRTIIEQDLIPDDVTIQVLTQSRPHIIEKTFAAIQGAKNVVVHLYNSTSFAQRQQVFRMSEDEIVDIAIQGARLFNDYADKMPETNFRFEYSPESFTGTEVEFALRICNAVIDVWQPRPERKVIINLPSTVEMSMPHVYAQQIEYMSKHLHCRENVIVSLHPHNDRGTAIAAAELGVLAGGQRVEGTLFGNGERTGNVDIVTLGMNLFTHGVDPNLDFSDMPAIVEFYEKLTGMSVSYRQPYSGHLVFAAFSGSHQDAIAKGMKFRQERDEAYWTVPYLPLDPHDVNREYETDVIRINSQSGKGGISYILEHNFGYDLPKEMAAEVGYFIKEISDHAHKELTPAEILTAFTQEYQNVDAPIALEEISWVREEGSTVADLTLAIAGKIYYLSARGNGPLDAVSNALKIANPDISYKFVDYEEHALETDSDSMASAYVLIADDEGDLFWGVGVDSDITMASVYALLTAVNRENRVKHFVEN